MDTSRFARRIAAMATAAFAGAAWMAKRTQRDLDRARATGRSARGRAEKGMRRAGGKLQGIGYRMQGRRPDPDATDEILEARVRSELGPVAHRLDLPRFDIAVDHGRVTVTGVVADEADIVIVERAILDVSGVRTVAPRLRIGLEPGDTRPSEGRRAESPSGLKRDLIGAVHALDIGDEAEAARLAAATTSEFLAVLPAGERRHVVGHLPADVRAMIDGSPPLPALAKPRSPQAFFTAVGGATGRTEGTSAQVAAAVLDVLRQAVPEEVADIEAVLPADLKTLWQQPLAGTAG